MERPGDCYQIQLEIVLICIMVLVENGRCQEKCCKILLCSTKEKIVKKHPTDAGKVQDKNMPKG
jgi:hypothetical protein